jgi:hypothetical protein
MVTALFPTPLPDTYHQKAIDKHLKSHREEADVTYLKVSRSTSTFLSVKLGSTPSRSSTPTSAARWWHAENGASTSTNAQKSKFKANSPC